MLRILKNKSAFTLLEVIISIVILTITIWSIYTLSVQSKKIMTKSEYSITAMYLAQEWLEFVRNIRDNELSESLNRDNPDNWWNKFLVDLWYWEYNNSEKKYENIEKWWYKLKKLDIKNNWKFELLNAWINNDLNFDKKISNLNDICTDIWEFKNCIYEHINIENFWNKENENFWKNFFRKIKIEKEFWETNLITVYSEIFWEEYWVLESFILEQKLWNIAIN